jgi:hypothetical protein
VRRLTPDDEKRIFEICLKRAVETGHGPRIPGDLSLEVHEAVMVIVGEYPDVKSASIENAKKVFAESFAYAHG